MRPVRIGLLLPLVMLVSRPAAAQLPDKFTNLQVLPKDIRRDSLVGIMRRFSLSLSVRCQYCHVGGDGVSFKGVEFAKDDALHKRRARFMMRMVDSLNRLVMPNVPEAGAHPFRIECKTCHRGSPRPLILTQVLEQVLDSAGIDSAVARYRTLRQNEAMEGRYDFTEWEVNLWAEQLAATDRTAAAIAIYQLNLEFFPKSASILGSLGRLHEPTDRAKAIDFYERSLSLQPRPDLRKRVDSLKALPSSGSR